MIAPLVPEIINNDLNLLVALLVGFGFGFALEQAGFSSTKKLAGVFYGYDFTVLRVFFTAGVTAMLGLLILGKLGWLDLSLIFVNPTFLYSAMLGGAIMGAGFIIGGFCPGTSVVGAAIGRIDAMFFVIGSALGVYIFGEFFPNFEWVYKAESLGALNAYDVLGLSKEVYAFGLTIIALGAFVGTYFIQSKVNQQKPLDFTDKTRRYKYMAFGAFLLIPAFIILITPDKEDRLFADAEKEETLEEAHLKYYTADKLAYKIIQKDSMVNLIDIRSKENFEGKNIPTSIHIPFEELQDRKYEDLLSNTSNINVLYADDVTKARKAVFILQQLKYPNLYVLNHTTDEFYATIMEEQQLPNNPSMQDKFNLRFRSKARLELPKIAMQMKAKPVIKVKKKKKIQGGCS